MQALAFSGIGEEGCQVDTWLSLKSRLTLELAFPQAQVDVLLKVVAGKANLYEYFPFIFQFAADAPQAEIGEIAGAFHEVQLLIENVRPAGGRSVVIDFESELSCIPAGKGIGPDERDIALLLKAIAVRPRPAAVQAVDATGSRRGASLARQRPDTGAPIFIIGSGRSGTSILGWALGQHPNIACIEETNWLPLTLYGAASGFQMASEPQRSAAKDLDIDEDDFLRHIGRAIDELHRDALRARATTAFLTRLTDQERHHPRGVQHARSNWSPKRRWVDGAPVNTVAALTIARAFPNGQFILTVRDPRQVIHSYERFAAAGGPNYTVQESAMWWLRATEVGLKARAKFGEDRVAIVFYDEMLKDPVGLMRHCFRFLKEPNFDVSAETFSARINATAAEAGEVGRAQIEDPLVAQCAEIYAEIRSGRQVHDIDWGEFAIGDVEGWEHDLRARMIGCISGATVGG
jgi:hypothetical protein